jgi:hypothetical protein
MANVQILKVGHAFFEGARGARGGAPSKDSICGVALVQGNLVTFGGRRGGELRYKTEKKINRTQVLANFDRKLVGNPFGKDIDAVYSELKTESERTVMVPGLTEMVGKGFYRAMAAGKLNTRATKAPTKTVE